ncbi:MAG: phosphotransferase [Pelagibacterales bacterium MED-G44]|nr:MAG: phosphotransferase [Pelagibacterales bacterium MED-G44]
MSKFQNLKSIKGDASFRKFFRKNNNNKNSIVVFAKKEKFKNLLVYDAINKIFNKNKILAPNLYEENYKKGYIEIQDFGDETIFKILLKKKSNKFKYFKKIVKILIQIQSIKNRDIKDFKKKKYIIPKYDKLILLKEARLFCDWYIKKKLQKKNRDKFNKKFKRITEKLISNLKLNNNVFVHRDFHVSNLMLVNNRIGVIDGQDALIGNKAYDLASLVDDVRLRTPAILKNKIYKFYINKQNNLNRAKFKNDFDILSVLRNLKIIGIFTRLAVRDGKKRYLKLIPRAWELINIRIDNQIFSELKKLLNQNFKKELNAN